MTGDKLFTYILKTEDEGKKYQEILLRRFKFSRKLIQKLKIGEKVWVDGEFVYLTSRGESGQTLVVNINEKEPPSVPAEHIPLEILYEDDIFLAVNKPPGQIVHPNSRYQSGTLANAVSGYWESQGESRPFRPIFRIDRNTSGIVLIAKCRYAHQQIAELSAKNKVDKKYLGLVEGRFPYENGKFSSPIRLTSGSKIIRETHPDGQPSLTKYRILQRYQDYTLLEFILLSGRTHQIRVHCQDSGYPLLGDDLYGGNTNRISRQALHCHIYHFTHPLTSKNIKIEAPLPQDMNSLISCGYRHGI